MTVTTPIAEQTVKAYTLRAFSIPYYEETLEFIQVCHPDGLDSYFRGTAEGVLEPGPFGGGYSWIVPKYIVKAATRFFNETFPPTTEEPA